jgi:hypothetical protein
MALFAPFIPVIIKIGVRVALAGKVSWVGYRLYQNSGNIPKTLVHLKNDLVHSYKFFTDEQYRKIKAAGETLSEKGAGYADLAKLLLSLAEIVTGTKLSNIATAIEKTKQILTAYQKLSPAEKQVVQKSTDLNVEETMHDALARSLYAQGIKIVGSEKPEGMELEEYLSHYYLGLYYIGRSGHKFSSEDVDSTASHLINLHSQVGPHRHKALINWYSAIGKQAPNEDLELLLSQCPEVRQLNVDTRYIAFALNQKYDNLSFDGVMEELLSRFPN